LHESTCGFLLRHGGTHPSVFDGDLGLGLAEQGRHQDGKRDNNAFHGELQLKKDTRGQGMVPLESKRIGSRTVRVAHAGTPQLAVKQLP
jgi:hypothetical protein